MERKKNYEKYGKGSRTSAAQPYIVVGAIARIMDDYGKTIAQYKFDEASFTEIKFKSEVSTIDPVLRSL